MNLRTIRLILWVLVSIALVGVIAATMTRRSSMSPAPGEMKMGAPFTLNRL